MLLMMGQNIISSMSLSPCLLKGDVNFSPQENILLDDFFFFWQNTNLTVSNLSGTKVLDKKL